MTRPKSILLISANKVTNPYPVYPLGLTYIESYIRQKLPGFIVMQADMNIETPESLSDIIIKLQPDYIGISLRNLDDYTAIHKVNFFEEYRKLIQIIRKNSHAMITIGGSAFSIFPETFFRELNPDFGITGEGEYKICELINSIENSTSEYKLIDGLLYHENNSIIFNKIKKKREADHTKLKTTFGDKLVGYYWQHGGMMNLQTKRGCPYKCIYCTYPLIEGSNVRTLNMDSIIDALGDLYFNHHIRYVFITDSVFNLKNDFNTEFAEKLISNNIKIKWGAYFSPKGLNLKLMKLFAQAGLKHVEFGTDSLSDIQLRNYRKDFNVKDVLRSSEICFEAKAYFAHFLILAGYGETENTLNETFENSKKINHTVYFPVIGMRIYPGTEIEKIAIKEGLIITGNNLLNDHYYISKNVNTGSIRERALKTGMKWVFPDDDMTAVFDMMRKKNKKGLLWHLIR